MLSTDGEGCDSSSLPSQEEPEDESVEQENDEDDDREEEEEMGPATGDDVMKALEEAFKKKQTRPAKKAKVDQAPKSEEKKGGDDEDGLDDIFSQLKKGKQRKNTDHGKSAAKAQGKKIMYTSLALAGFAQNFATEDDNDWFNSRGMRQSGRKYVDGLPVYTEDELRIGKGGGTFPANDRNFDSRSH